MLALKNYLTTTLQTTSTHHMPTCVTDLIADYAAPDYSIALEEFDVDRFGEITNTARNTQIAQMIHRAITSPDCDPKIKSKIMSAFRTGSEDLVRPRALRDIIFRAQSLRHQINLDNVDFSGLVLRRLALGNMTARGASFIRTDITETDLTGADLTAAVFHRSRLFYPELEGTTLINTRWDTVQLAACDLVQADLRGATYRWMIFSDVDLHTAITDDQNLQSVINAHKRTIGISFFGPSAVLNGIYSSGRVFRPSDSSVPRREIRVGESIFDPYYRYLP